ncbi:ammonium transporter [Novosphingobium sp. Chol11]|uniref:ammonium transporter n=1 Tax=Novosphingobium sp. Chol11 TaxID=1385763 RepID=UPI0025F11D27|nr:ammonium transporter [Novosphingobium sp. Chol11]
MRKLIAMAAAGAALVLPLMAWAQDTDVATLDVADSGDTAWALAASVMVLFMALPGLTLFYGARVTAKNFLSVAAQIGAITAICSLLWVVAGYTIAFGQITNGWLGSGNAWMLIDLGNVRGDTAVPESAFALFHMTLAVFAAALMVGAWAGRARFAWVIAFSAVWSLMVYAPMAHWIWGGGWLASRLGTLDDAGGLVIHTAAGVSGLVAAMLMGKRSGFTGAPIPPHAAGLAMAGGALLWAGWLALLGGAALAATDDAAAAMINAHVAACAAALVWLVIESFAVGKPSATGFATGAVAGLAAVSSAAASIAPGAAMLLGGAAALLSYPAMLLIRRSLAIDDALGVFAVNGVSGMVGAVLLAAFIDPALGGTGFAPGMGLVSQMVAQIAAVGVVAAWSAIGTVVAALMVSTVIPMRVTEDTEREGLDFINHGERAWGE